MFNPNLVVIAGCNGACKPTCSKNFLPEGLFAFDADYKKKQFHAAFSFDFELWELMPWNKTFAQLKSEIDSATSKRRILLSKRILTLNRKLKMLTACDVIV